MSGSTINLPSDLQTRVIEQARQRGVTPESLIREALEAHLPKPAKPTADDPFLMDHAVFTGESPPDLSLQHDEYLYGDSR